MTDTPDRCVAAPEREFLFRKKWCEKEKKRKRLMIHASSMRSTATVPLGECEEEDSGATDRHPMTHDRAKVVNELLDSDFNKSFICDPAAEELVGDLSNKTEEGKTT